MKNLIYLSSVSLLVLLAACGGESTTPKKIEPTTTEFRSGELARYIEVESEASELTYSEVEGAIGTQYIRLNVPVKMVKDGFKDVDPRDISFTSLLAVAIVDLIDENGSKVQDLDLKSDDCLKLKKLLTQEKGATEVLVFEGTFHNSEDAPKWFEAAISYTPTLTANIEVDNPSDDSDTEVVEEITMEESDEDSNDSYSSSSSSSDENFDEFLAAYEKYIDKYIALMKKAKNGDYSAMSDAASLMSEAQEYGEKLQKLSGNLTPAQLAKFQKLQQKLISAAQ